MEGNKWMIRNFHTILIAASFHVYCPQEAVISFPVVCFMRSLAIRYQPVSLPEAPNAVIPRWKNPIL
jgi:hypothetical protein